MLPVMSMSSDCIQCGKVIERVWVVSCKSWQAGFDPRKRSLELRETKWCQGGRLGGRSANWSRESGPMALIAKVESLTGSTQFTYITAVTKLRGDASLWEEYAPFKNNLRGNPIKILTLQEMLSDLYKKTNTTIASSEVGRLLQVIKASGWKP